MCRTANYTIITFFGQKKGGSDCDFSVNVNMKASNVIPGEPRCFEVNDSILRLSSGEEYCYNGSLIGDAGLHDGELHTHIYGLKRMGFGQKHLLCFLLHSVFCHVRPP